MAFLNPLKAKLFAVGAAVIAALLAVIKVLSSRNARLKTEYKAVKKSMEFREKVDTIDAEIEQEFSHRAEEARKDIESDEIPEHLANPSNN